MKEIGEALPWLGFWIAFAVFIYCEHRQYMAGHDGMFWCHKTDAEKAIQARKVDGEL